MASDSTALDEAVALAGGEANVSRRWQAGDALNLRLKDCGLANLQAIEQLDGVRSARIAAGVLTLAFADGVLLPADEADGEDDDLDGWLDLVEDDELETWVGAPAPAACASVSASPLDTHRRAGEILAVVGGRANVRAVSCCITRLRFVLVDGSKFDEDRAMGVVGVIKILHAGGQYQLVLGEEVDSLYEELVYGYGLTGALDDVSATTSPATDESLLGSAIAAVSGSMGPLAALLSCAGLLQGLLSLLACLGLITQTDGVYLVFSSLPRGVFALLPVFLGYTSAKMFGLSRYCGMALGTLLVFASSSAVAQGEPLGSILAGTPFELVYYIAFLGIPVLMPAGGYAFSIIPVLLATWVGSLLQQRLDAVVPHTAHETVSLLLFCLIMAPFTLLVAGPVGGLASAALAACIQAIWQIPCVGPALLGLAFGASWSTLVMYGLQGLVIVLVLNNIALLGFDPICAVAVLGGYVGVSQGAAVALKTKDPQLKSAAWPAVASQALGVGEPMLYGIQLPHRSLYAQNVAFSAVGGLVLGLLRVKAYALCGFGVFCLPSYVDEASGDMSGLLAALAVIATLMVASFCFTYLSYRDDGC